MAKDSMTPKLNKGRISGIKDIIQTTLDRLYSSTYLSPSSLNTDLDMMKNSLDKSIDLVAKYNEERPNMNTQALYQRIMQYKKSDEGDISDKMENLFEDKALTESLMPTLIQNKLLKQYDEDVDTLCKFVPSLEEALEVKRDHVLCSDYHTKEFINIINKSISDKEEMASFNSKMEGIKKRYNLSKLYTDSYTKAAKYGEDYIYITSYNKAFAKLLQNNSNLNVMKESFVSLEEYATNVGFKDYNTDMRDFKRDNNQVKVFFFNNVIPSVVKEQTKINTIQEAVSNNKFGNNFNDSSTKFEGIDDNRSVIDGLIDTNIKETDFKINGAIVRRLKRENVIPIYMNDICMGYYYIECNGNIEDAFDKGLGMKNNLGFMSSKKQSMFDVMKDNDQDNALKFLSTKLSQKIDKQFINNNQDLKKEIYHILKNNEVFNKSDVSLNVSYISPNEMVPMMFKEDEESHRGLSDLEKSMINGKLYASLITTNTLGIITRGFDKRVYYVKQQVDTNISQILLNTVSQIKKSNFGTREISNLKNSLNMTGRYNDLLIPVGASGDYPVNFEIMPGQDIDPKQELCESLEQQAVNSTGVPYEYVQAESQVDFATRLTMSNVKFLRIIMARQTIVEFFYTQILLKIWEAEGEDINDTIEVKLNPPTYLNLVNMSELYRGMTDYSQMIVDNCVLGNNEDLKAITKKNIISTYLNGVMDMNALDEIIKDSEMEYRKKFNKEEE